MTLKEKWFITLALLLQVLSNVLWGADFFSCSNHNCLLVCIPTYILEVELFFDFGIARKNKNDDFPIIKIVTLFKVSNLVLTQNMQYFTSIFGCQHYRVVLNIWGFFHPISVLHPKLRLSYFQHLVSLLCQGVGGAYLLRTISF